MPSGIISYVHDTPTVAITVLQCQALTGPLTGHMRVGGPEEEREAYRAQEPGQLGEKTMSGTLMEHPNNEGMSGISGTAERMGRR